MRTRFGLTLLALSLVAAACGSGDSDTTTPVAADPTTTTTTATTTTAPPATTTTTVAVDQCAVDQLNLVEAGVLTVATGEPVFPPWMGVGDDNFDVPESKTGFEGAFVYALASELGFSDDQVVFVRTGFNEAIAPGPKGWDFNIQQYSISADRDEVVDFSNPYYTTRQALVTLVDSEFANATSVADLSDAKLGVAIGTTSLAFVDDIIQPDSEPNVYDENVDVEAAMNAGQIDGLVVDLPTAYFVTCCQVDGSVIAGQFEAAAAAPDDYGLLFADGNSLVGCVNSALAQLKIDGTLQGLEDTWLTQDGGVPIITG